jgi:hypothetical protein
MLVRLTFIPVCGKVPAGGSERAGSVPVERGGELHDPGMEITNNKYRFLNPYPGELHDPGMEITNNKYRFLNPYPGELHDSGMEITKYKKDRLAY